MPGPVVFDGGADADRTRVLEVHQAYLDANASFDGAALRTIWSDDATNVFFNLNGHTYVGLDHWLRLWDHYRIRLGTGTWTPEDVKVVIRGDMAVVTCHRHSPTAWIGQGPTPAGYTEDPDRRSRSTMVLVRERGDWKAVHAHFSEMSRGPRPGGI